MGLVGTRPGSTLISFDANVLVDQFVSDLRYSSSFFAFIETQTFMSKTKQILHEYYETSSSLWCLRASAVCVTSHVVKTGWGKGPARTTKTPTNTMPKPRRWFHLMGSQRTDCWNTRKETRTQNSAMARRVAAGIWACVWPILFAGTWRQYSPPAISHEIKIAFHIGHVLEYLRWRYHATVITQQEQTSNKIAAIAGQRVGISCCLYTTGYSGVCILISSRT